MRPRLRYRWEQFTTAARDYAWGLWVLAWYWRLARRNRAVARKLNRETL